MSEDPALRQIHNFIHFVVRAAASPRQRERVALATRGQVIPSDSQVAALRAIDSNGPLSIGELADTLRLDPTTVSRLVAGLDRLGVVERQSDLADGRRSVLVVTTEGSKLLKARDRVSLQDYRVATQDWSDRDKAKLASLLERLERDLSRLEFDAFGRAVGPREDVRPRRFGRGANGTPQA